MPEMPFCYCSNALKKLFNITKVKIILTKNPKVSAAKLTGYRFLNYQMWHTEPRGLSYMVIILPLVNPFKYLRNTSNEYIGKL